MRTSRYRVNSLNQYTQRTVPGAVDVLGEAAADAVVTVNDQAADRHGGYYRKELRADNTPAAVWLGVTNRAVNTNGSADMLTNVTGNIFLARTPEIYQYDADGNLTNDGRFQYTWDAENRLIAAVAMAGPPESLVKETWSHLPDGRWAERVISNKVGGVWTLVSTQRFAWDGKVLLAVLDATNGISQSYVRGLDLSGSLQGAGGVGGLLMVSEISNAQISHHFAIADGNGNITTLASATNAAVTARYEYGPFGETLRATGPMVQKNLLRFSTQFTDEVTGTVKYLYRDYRTIEGRWMSRDPIAERGGKNLYTFSGNDAVDFFDVLGLAWKVERKGRNRAHAKPQNGDTVEGLAKLIRLDNKDYRNWLKPVGRIRIPGSVTESITDCAEFTIPNTVFVDIGPRIRAPWYLQYVDKINTTFTFLSAMARKTGDRYESKGFNVVRTEQATGTDIRNHLGSQNIHAYVFAGHGANGAINSTEDDAVFPGRYTQYGIQFMGLLACGSALDNSGEGMNDYPSNVARRGKFYGSINNYTALLAIMLGVGEYVFIWTPGTNE